MQLYDVHLECKRRTKRICINLCLLPPNNSVTLSDAINLVFASLNYEAPNSCYDTPGSTRPWIRGMKHKLVGPQLWMATRKFVVQRVEEMLEAEGIDWIESSQRREHLQSKYMPLLEEYLITWRPVLSETPQADNLRKYAESVWTRFTIDHLSGGNDVLKFHKLTESYVHFVAEKLESRNMCPQLPGRGSTAENDFSSATENLKGIVMKYVKKIRYDVIPFAQDLDAVTNAVWERLNSKFVRIQANHISALSVRDVLDDLEDDSNFLSYQNGLYKVRVSMAALNVMSTDGSGDNDGGEIHELPNAMDSSATSIQYENSKVEESDLSTITEVSNKNEKGNDMKNDFDDDPLIKHTWKFSTKKEIGARVYAEFTNGDYYWGHIGQVVTTKGSDQKKYFVQFEDGDFLEDIPENKVYSETDYKRYFEIDPPPPPKETDQERRRRRRMKKPESVTGSKKESKKRKRTSNDISQERDDAAQSANLDVDAKLDSCPNNRKKQKTMVSDLTNEECLLLDDRAIKSGRSETGESLRMSPRLLRKNRCKKCALCKMRDCGKCMTCLRNLEGQSGSSKEVCLRKMCCTLPIEVKAQPAVGFPPGWTFIFGDARKASFRGVIHPPLINGLSIIAPNGRKYHSVEAAKIHNKAKVGDIDTVSLQFFAQIGIASYEIDSSHFLVGKGYCHEWTDIKGRKNILFGVITSCSRDSRVTDDVMFTVEYSNESASFVNSISNSFGCPIPSAQLIPSALAWGGCVAFERRHKSRRGHGSVVRSIDKSMSCKSWVTPDMRIEEMVDNGDGLTLPKLTIIFRGFKLVFSVKKSTKPDAGNGLFVKCFSLMNDMDASGGEKAKVPESLFLNAGELLDLGIYAPFRSEDKKHECIFKLKNYIYSQVCEEWCFNAMEDDHQYDITDDLSGDVHDLAKKHVLMYVNECGINETPTIHAEFDPEGSVHYLLGVSYNGSWKDYEEGLKQMNIKAGGDEVEVFVNYGQDYERARLRKGYSTLLGEDKKVALEEMESCETGFVQDVSEYTLEELSKCVDFFNSTFSNANLNERNFTMIDEEVKRRCLTVLNKLELCTKAFLENEVEEQSKVLGMLQTVSNILKDVVELKTNNFQRLSDNNIT
uniref:CXXC-type domain-containing protein n=3 Tax=Ditylum brightwellii TaxID=49249 RepID=A0A7S4RGV3_9STRA